MSHSRVDSFAFYPRLLWVLAVALTVVISGCGGNGSGSPPSPAGIPFTYNKDARKTTYSINVPAPSKSAIRIENVSGATQTLRLSLNGKQFFQSNQDLLDEIRQLPDEIAAEPLERKIWRYIRDNRIHRPSLTEENWYHSPTLFMNSLGFGICDDSAALLYQIATSAGIQARVWALTSHVVAEVFTNGKWKMYDPELGAYYENDDGQVAGVEELAMNADLITSPRNQFTYQPDLHDSSMNDLQFAEFVASLYTTADDNSVIRTIETTIPPEIVEFTLPPRVTLDFPGKFETCFSFNVQILKCEQLRITVPAGFSGLMSNSLVISSIMGEGRAQIDGYLFDINSYGFRSYVRNYLVWRRDFQILESDTPVTFTYLLNPQRFFLLNHNQLEITGVSPDDISISIISI